MASQRRKKAAKRSAGSARRHQGAQIAPSHGRPGSETNPITIPQSKWGPGERELHASVRDGRASPKRAHRRAVLAGLRRLAGKGDDWQYQGQIARQLAAPEAQPVLEQLVDEGIAERAIRECGLRSIVYRLGAGSPERPGRRSS